MIIETIYRPSEPFGSIYTLDWSS